jgi:hypothetical protein
MNWSRIQAAGELSSSRRPSIPTPELMIKKPDICSILYFPHRERMMAASAAPGIAMRATGSIWTPDLEGDDSLTDWKYKGKKK